jgi:hypothetical protein
VLSCKEDVVESRCLVSIQLCPTLISERKCPIHI